MQFLDWVAVVSSAATVVATVLALVAIVQSSRQARGNAELIVEERRRDVQLDALGRLGDALALPVYNSDQRWQRRRSAEIALAIIEAPVPLCRARFSRRPLAEVVAALGVPTDTPEDAIDGATDASGVWTLDRLVDEVVAAIRTQTG